MNLRRGALISITLLISSAILAFGQTTALQQQTDKGRQLADSLIDNYLNNISYHDSTIFKRIYQRHIQASPELVFDLTMHGVNNGFLKDRAQAWEDCITHMRNFDPMDTLYLSKSLNYGGGAWHRKGNIARAKTYFLEVIELLPPDKIDEELAVAHNNLGAILDNHNDPGAAYANYAKAHDIFETLLGPEHYYIGIIGNNMGQSLNRLKRYEEQIEIQEQSLEILRKGLGENHRTTGNLYLNLGIVYRQTGQYKKSMASFRSALRVRENLGDHAGMIAARSEIAQLMAADDSSYTAEDVRAAQLSAIALGEELLGRNSKATASLHNNLALAWLGDGHPREALHHIQRSIVLTYSLPDSSGAGVFPLQQHIGIPSFQDFQLFENKGYILHDLYLLSDSLHHIDLSCKTYLIGDSVLDRLRVELINGMSREPLIRQAADYYINATQSAMTAYRNTHDIGYLELAFQWIEKSRNWELMTMYVADGHIASVEDSILHDIRRLRSMLPSTYYSDDNDSTRDSVNSTIDIEMTRLKRRHPEYFNLLYGFTPAPLSEVRTYCIEHSVNWLHYFMLPQGKYDCLLVTPDTFRLLPKPLSNDSLSFYSDAIAAAIEKRDWSFVHSSAALYELLIAPFEDALDDNSLVVSSGDNLTGIPFDVLLNRQAVTLTPAELPEHYFINRFDISHVPSATYGLRISKHSGTAHTSIFIAPEYDDGSLSTSVDEVAAASRILNGKQLLGQVSIEDFENSLTRNDIVHFAGHSFGNDSNTDRTYLLLGDGTDTLFLRSILGGETSAKLAVLSSCHSATGVHRHEGQLGLTYAFAFSGTPNVISSIWEVPDRETGQIFKVFYRFMQEAIPSTESLRKAKLEYLREAPLPGQHPYYWSGWIVTGNEVTFEPLSSRPYLYLVGLIGIIAILFFAFRTYWRAS